MFSLALRLAERKISGGHSARDLTHPLHSKGPQTPVASPVTLSVLSCCLGTSSTDYQGSHLLLNCLKCVPAHSFLVQAWREEVSSVEECSHHSFLMLCWIVRRKIQIFVGVGCFLVSINLYRTIPQHGYLGVKKEKLWPLSVWHACSIVNWMLLSKEFRCWWKHSASVFFKYSWSCPHTSTTSEEQLER